MSHTHSLYIRWISIHFNKWFTRWYKITLVNKLPRSMDSRLHHHFCFCILFHCFYTMFTVNSQFNTLKYPFIIIWLRILKMLYFKTSPDSREQRPYFFSHSCLRETIETNVTTRKHILVPWLYFWNSSIRAHLIRCINPVNDVNVHN